MVRKNIKISRELLEQNKKWMKVITSFGRDLKKKLGTKLVAIILAGSRAKHDFNMSSDVDLLIIGHWKEDVLFERISEIARLIDLPELPVDYFLYRPEEIKQLIKKGNPLILDGISEGKAILNIAYLKELRNYLEELMQKKIISKKGDVWFIKDIKH